MKRPDILEVAGEAVPLQGTDNRQFFMLSPRATRRLYRCAAPVLSLLMLSACADNSSSRSDSSSPDRTLQEGQREWGQLPAATEVPIVWGTVAPLNGSGDQDLSGCIGSPALCTDATPTP